MSNLSVTFLLFLFGSILAQSALASARLQKQSTAYVQKTRDIILRWSAQTERGLKISAQPLKLASRSSPGAASSMGFRFVNMTKTNLTYVAKPVVTPGEGGGVTSIQCRCFAALSLAPGESATADVTLTLAEDFPEGIDTVVVRLDVTAVPDQSGSAKSAIVPSGTTTVADGSMR
jgi:cytochrome c oxidase assembly protein Cox11